MPEAGCRGHGELHGRSSGCAPGRVEEAAACNRLGDELGLERVWVHIEGEAQLAVAVHLDEVGGREQVDGEDQGRVHRGVRAPGSHAGRGPQDEEAGEHVDEEGEAGLHRHEDRLGNGELAQWRWWQVAAAVAVEAVAVDEVDEVDGVDEVGV